MNLVVDLGSFRLPWQLEAITTANGKNKRKQMPKSVLKLPNLNIL
jgi:hypothetical protein